MSMYKTVAIVIMTSLIYLDIPNYVFVLHPAILPKYFYYVFAAIIAPVALLKWKKIVLYMVSPFALWGLAEIVFHSYDLLNSSDEAVIHLTMLRIQIFFLTLLLGFITSITRTASYEGIFWILAITSAVMVIIDFMAGPGTFFPIEKVIYGRAAAMYINPNRAAEVILLTTCLLAIPTLRLQYRIPLLLLSGVSIILTFARGPILVWILFWLFLLVTRKLPKYNYVFSLVAFAVLPLLLSIFKSYLLSRLEIGPGVKDLLGRLDFFESQNIHDDSAQERIAVLKAGWRMFLDNPLFGAGSGITDIQSYIWPYRVNVHNQLVMVAAEQGLLGVVLLGWLIVILWRGSYFQDIRFQHAAAVGTLLLAFFTHNMFDNLYWTMTFAFISGRRKA